MIDRSLRSALFVLISLAIGQAPHGQQAPPLVLKGATIIDGTGAAPIVNATLLVEGDRIRSVIRDGGALPAGAQVIDLAGKFVIPGLIDSHVHWGPWMGELYVNHGVTSVLVQLDVPAAERASYAASLSTPRVFHCGGRPELKPGMTDEQARQTVAEWMKKTPNIAWLPDFRKVNAEPYRRIAEEAHRQGFFVFSHAQNAPDAIKAGMDIAEHIWGFAQGIMAPDELQAFQRGKYPTWAVFLNDWQRLDPIIKEFAGRGLYLNPTLDYEWGSLSPQALEMEKEAYALLSNPALSYFPQNLAGTLLIRHRQIKNFSDRYEHMAMLDRLAPQDREQFVQGYRNIQEFVRRFVQAGGKILSGTDASSVAIPGLAMHHEMQLLVEAGLTPMQALRASTGWAAEVLAGKNGALGDPGIGVIKAGNLADLVILDANPLDDIRNTKKIARVMKGGKFLEFGYHADYYTFATPPRTILMSTPLPEISSIAPHAVTEGDPEFEMTVEGAGFTGTSIVKIGGVSMPTRFDGPRKLRMTVPARMIERLGSWTIFPATIPLPDRFGSPGPEQNVGIFGDHTVPITVYNPTPEGGTSNSVSLMVKAKWHKEGPKQ